MKTLLQDADSDAQRQKDDVSPAGHRASARGQRHDYPWLRQLVAERMGARQRHVRGQVLDGSNRYREAGVEPTFAANVGPSPTLTLDSMELYWNG
jgi:hypothetical protein